jgi:hypothetical protein
MNCRTQRILATTIVAGAIAAGLAAAEVPAQAGTPACDGGSRTLARQWAATGDFYTASETTWIEGTAYNKVELRLNDATQCGWGRLMRACADDAGRIYCTDWY